MEKGELFLKLSDELIIRNHPDINYFRLAVPNNKEAIANNAIRVKFGCTYGIIVYEIGQYDFKIIHADFIWDL